MTPPGDSASPASPPGTLNKKQDFPSSISSGSSPNEDTGFPKGQCRYILISPGLRGQRCGCANFQLNKTVPGAICDCGHLSCFHLVEADAPSPGRNQSEIETLKRRTSVLEQQYHDSETGGVVGGLISRVGQLEEALDKAREDAQAEIKGSYRNISGAWQQLVQMQRRMAVFEESFRRQSESLERTTKEVQELRNRHLELVDSDESLEERIEQLESSETVLANMARDPRHQSVSLLETASHAAAAAVAAHRRRSSVSRPAPTLNTAMRAGDKSDKTIPAVQPGSPATSGESWTVHVSLLPSAQQPLPFEKDTISYKRCLSRGLHRMVAVEDHTASSFLTAVSRTFRDILQGRAWAPLQARLCRAEKLQGMPMLKPLDASTPEESYDFGFIREHCAVRDNQGRIESIYIALRHEKLSWGFLRGLPVFVEGLESCWAHDKFLDSDKGDATEVSESPKHARGIANQETVSTSQGPSTAGTKRCASEAAVSSSGFGSGGITSEGDAPRNKIPRSCLTSGVAELRHGARSALKANVP